jgi:primase-polymerase (primpol)-like protein
MGPPGAEGEEVRGMNIINVAAWNIAAELREPPQWVVWRAEHRPAAVKPTRVPYRAADPSRRASSTDARTWAPFEQALSTYYEREDVNGIGFVFSADDPFVGIDLDKCRYDGVISPAARLIVSALNSYTEISPSARGLHIIVRARLEGEGRRRAGVEMYSEGRFFSVTGRLLPSLPGRVKSRQAELDELRARLFPPLAPPSRIDSGVVPQDDRELLERAFDARNGVEFSRLWNGDTTGYPSPSEADLALVSHLAFWTGGDPDRIDRLFRSSGLYREKWERADYRARTIAKALGS